MSAPLALALLLAGCTTIVEQTAGSPEEQIEEYCRENGVACGKVYAFQAVADNPLGRVELCVLEADLPAAEALFGESELSPDPRFDKFELLGVSPWCFHHCAGGSGCNAYGGCFCAGP